MKSQVWSGGVDEAVESGQAGWKGKAWWVNFDGRGVRQISTVRACMERAMSVLGIFL